ncbi:MAG: hypothetical protein HN730_07950 [Bdellovibrionales bacterium]|nr:hypothetical protein [Bdellovibrionales bacterium]MBT7767074.1 hypothetical protein [Bdellovibrionales bacterium]
MALIYILGLIFLLIGRAAHPRFIPSKTPEMIKGRITLLKQSWQQQELVDLLAAYSSGYRRGLDRKSRRMHNRLYIAHLFTPSGIHLSALLWGVMLLLQLTRHLFPKFDSKKRLAIVMPIMISLIPFILLGGYYSIKRICALRLLTMIKVGSVQIVTPTIAFFLVFLFDYLWGSYDLSPNSFAYSFIFLGSIVTMGRGRPKVAIPLALLGGQVVVALVTQVPLNPIAFGIGLIITAIFSAVFPLLLLIFWATPSILPSYGQWPLQLLYQIVEWGYALVVDYRGLTITAPLFLGMILWSLLPIRRWRQGLVISLLLLLIDSNPILNLPADRFYARPPNRVVVPISRQQMRESSRKSDGYHVVYRNGLSCRYRIGHGRHQRRCYRR